MQQPNKTSSELFLAAFFIGGNAESRPVVNIRIAYLKVDGALYPLKGNFTVSPSALERAGIAGQDYIHGFSEMPRLPVISGDVSTVPELSVDDVEAVVNSTVTAELANGKVYVLREAWCTSALELNTREGQMRVTFQGISCDEIG